MELLFVEMKIIIKMNENSNETKQYDDDNIWHYFKKLNASVNAACRLLMILSVSKIIIV